MVVLVNRGSAAGSEIVAAALQDQARARIAGTPTFGGTTIQTILPIADDAALRRTTSRPYSPNGRSIADGVQPDVILDDEPIGAFSADDRIVMRAVELLRGQPGP